MTPVRLPDPDARDAAVEGYVRRSYGATAYDSLGALAVSALFVAASTSSSPALIALPATAGVLALVLTGMWRSTRRSCRVTATGLRVKGFWRDYDVPWAELSAVSWTPYISGRKHTWAHVWVSFYVQDQGLWNVQVSATGRSQTAETLATLLWKQLPAAEQAHVVLSEGKPQRAREADWLPVTGVLKPRKVVRSAPVPMRREEAEAWVPGSAVFEGRSLLFCDADTGHRRTWTRIVRAHVEAHRNPEDWGELQLRLVSAEGRSRFRYDAAQHAVMAEVVARLVK